MTVTSSRPKGFCYQDLPEPAWPRHEIVDGSLFVTLPGDEAHELVVSRLKAALDQAVPEDLSPLIGAAILSRAETDRVLVPDLVVVDAAAVRQAPAGTAVFLDPKDVHLVVEVISPATRVLDLDFKPHLYAEWDIDSYRVLDPQDRWIYDYGPRSSADWWEANSTPPNIWPSRIYSSR